jgi:class 3 adenylate cyclase/TolB-like protein/tetratricopeptide (TPR) repeat protein
VRDQRRLAAIVSADVAGYSRLMGEDESRTLAVLKAHRRELIDPKIAEYGGRIVKTTGDGLLLEFPSVVEAVRCAVDVQRGMAERNAEVTPDQRMEFRVGINVGDIIIDGDDIYGDGVNVAARLQALAEPGQICVSKVVRDQVLDKLSFAFEELGAQQVKNIARPVEVYRILDDPSAATAEPRRVAGRGGIFSRIARGARWGWRAGSVAAAIIAGIAVWYAFIQPRTPAAGPPVMSVAIMPFTPAAASAEDERYAERLTLDVTSSFERTARTALVVSHGLALKYKDKATDPRSVGHDLNVRYLVEGDVRNESGRTVVQLRLVETTDGTQVWSTPPVGSFAAKGNEEMVGQLTNRLGKALYDAEEKRVAHRPRAEATATELALQADRLLDQDNNSLKSALAARKLYEEALRRDPDSIVALVGLYGAIETQLIQSPSADHDRLVKEMDDISARAVVAGRNDVRAWNARTDALAYQWKWDGAFEASAEALRIDPYRTSALAEKANLLIRTGRLEEALPVCEQAIALDPSGWNVSNCLQYQCLAHLLLGHYDDAIATCNKAQALDDSWLRRTLLIAAYAQKGDTEKAAAAKAELLKRRPDMSIALLKGLQVSDNPVYVQQRETHLYAGLRKAGIPEQ